MILNHQLESMWKELAMVQFQVLHLVEENEKSYYSLSENRVPVKTQNRALLITGEKLQSLS